MARPLRIEYPGAYYHVMNRGQSRRNIFIDKGRQTFLDLLAERGTDGSDLSRPPIGRSQASRNRQNGWTRETVVGELGLFADERASGEEEAA